MLTGYLSSKNMSGLTEFNVMAAMATMTEELTRKSSKALKMSGTRKLYYDKDLKCGILEIKDAERLGLVRDLLVQSLQVTPRLQFLTRADRLTPVLTSYAPRVYNGMSNKQYVKFLVAHHDILCIQLFKLLTTTPTTGGRTFRFEMTQYVVEYVSQMGSESSTSMIRSISTAALRSLCQKWDSRSHQIQRRQQKPLKLCPKTRKINLRQSRATGNNHERMNNLQRRIKLPRIHTQTVNKRGRATLAFTG
jgi:hypothetical protein